MANSDTPTPQPERQDRHEAPDGEKDNARSSWMSDLVKSTANAALGDPIRAVAQVTDTVVSQLTDGKIRTDLNGTVKSAFSAVGLDAPQAAEFGTSNWYAQQLGNGVGMMLPFMGLRRLAVGKLLGEPLLAREGAGVLSGGLLRYAGAEAALSGTSGLIYGGLLRTSDDKNIGTGSFWTERALHASNDAVSFALLGATNPYTTKAFGGAASLIEARGINASLLRGPVLSGAVAGIPGGAINAEVGAWHDGRLLATGQEFKEAIVGNAFVGGAFGTAHRMTAPNTESQVKRPETSPATETPVPKEPPKPESERLAPVIAKLSDSVRALPPDELRTQAYVAETYSKTTWNKYFDESKGKVPSDLLDQSAAFVNSGLSRIPLETREKFALVAAEFHHPGSLQELANHSAGDASVVQTALNTWSLRPELPLAIALEFGARPPLDRAALQIVSPKTKDIHSAVTKLLQDGESAIWQKNPNYELAIEHLYPEMPLTDRRLVSRALERLGTEQKHDRQNETNIAFDDIFHINANAFKEALNHVDRNDETREKVMSKGLNYPEYYRGDNPIGRDRYDDYVFAIDQAMGSVSNAYKLAAAFGDRWHDAAQTFGWQPAAASGEGRLRTDHWIGQKLAIASPAEMRATGDWLLNNSHIPGEQLALILTHKADLNQSLLSLPTEKLGRSLSALETHLENASYEEYLGALPQKIDSAGYNRIPIYSVLFETHQQKKKYGRYDALALGRGELQAGELLTLQRAINAQEMREHNGAIYMAAGKIGTFTPEQLRNAIRVWESNPKIPVEIAIKYKPEVAVAAMSQPHIALSAERAKSTNDAKVRQQSVAEFDKSLQRQLQRGKLLGKTTEAPDALLAMQRSHPRLDESTQRLAAATAIKSLKPAKAADVVATMDGQIFRDAISLLDATTANQAKTIADTRLPPQLYFANEALGINANSTSLALKISTIFAEKPEAEWRGWLDNHTRNMSLGGSGAEIQKLDQALPLSTTAQAKGLADWLLASKDLSPEQFGPVAKHWSALKPEVRALPAHELVQQMQTVEKELTAKTNPAWNLGQTTIDTAQYAYRIGAGDETAPRAALAVINAGFGGLPLKDQHILHAAARYMPMVLSEAPRTEVLNAVGGWEVDASFPLPIAQRVAAMDQHWHKVAARMAWDSLKEFDPKIGMRGEPDAPIQAQFDAALEKIQSKGRTHVAENAADLHESVRILHPQLSALDQILLAHALDARNVGYENAKTIESIDSASFARAMDDMDSTGLVQHIRQLHHAPRRLDTRLVEAGRQIDPSFPIEVAVQVAKLPTTQHQHAAKVAWQELRSRMPELGPDEKLSPEAKTALKRQFLRIKKELGDGQDLTQAVSVNEKFDPLRDTQVRDKVAAALHIPPERASALLAPFYTDLIKQALESHEASDKEPSSRSQTEAVLNEYPRYRYHDLANVGIGHAWQHVAAAGLATTFGDHYNTYLSEMSRRGINDHDASHFLPIAPPDAAHGLGEWLLNPDTMNRVKDDDIKLTIRKLDHNFNVVKTTESITGAAALAVVAQRWAGLTPAERALPFEKIVIRARSNNYSNIQHQEFADTSSAVGVAAGTKPGQFEYNQHRFLASLETPSPFPVVPVEQSKWTSGDLVGVFLPRNDTRGLYIGALTGCCQHPNGEAKTSAWHGQESPNGGFFAVVRRSNPEKIVAAAWTMVTPDRGMLIDSIEGSGLNWRRDPKAPDERPDVQNIFNMMANDLVQDRFHRVTSAARGGAGLDFSQWPKATEQQALAVAIDHSGYSDSSKHNQVIMAQSTTVQPQPLPNKVWVRGATMEDKAIAQKLAEQIYPSGDRNVPYGDFGLVLNNGKGQPIGYAILDVENRQINDIAVLPAKTQADALKQHRDAAVLIKAVMKKVESVGGEWSADARASTSYKILMNLARKGVIDVTSPTNPPEIVRYMGSKEDNDPVYRVTFHAAQR